MRFARAANDETYQNSARSHPVARNCHHRNPSNSHHRNCHPSRIAIFHSVNAVTRTAIIIPSVVILVKLLVW
ncbi:hypothetical protein SODALDRAFT_116046 [Sodiomyces alkalinus F11]|uniref:Uncharacterized protein n=1 Tax=Sodiomyces alkalinus (strain CBS 110278 / VKM F-3762 / F11) TaxID=1314773 RepID=A0A3N2Q3H3_SODAK|nr:hypothetical protein SODALDRAFT_116046 [Sodiomyces alkalinus F11]ROT41292.1 hypothetical protein SODALDRAFT_116046 [Sodiomyces alkalinus F11]